MRRLLLVIMVGLLVGAGVMALVERDPGLVVISYGNTTIETSVWLALLVWLLVWWLAAMTLRLLRGTLALRHSVAGWMGGRKTRNAAILTNRGLISYIEGNWARSRRQLLRAARYSRAPLLNYLVAARASFRLGDAESMQRYLGEAEGVESEAHIALELTQAELQLDAGHDEQALATLVRARDNASRHPYVLELLTKAYTRLGDWKALQALLPELRKADVLEPEKLQALELATWEGLLRSACASETDAVGEVTRLWTKIPKPLVQQSTVLKQCYVECLLAQQAWDKCERFIVAELDRHWDEALVGRIGSFPASKPEKLLKTLRRWLDGHGSDPVLLLAAARVALQSGDENAAHNWMTQAYDIAPSAELCLELARLKEGRGEIKGARRLVQQAAEIAVGPLPDWRQAPPEKLALPPG